MVYFVFACGVLAGMAAAALLWIGASTAVLVAGLGMLLLLCGLLSSAVAFVISAPESSSEDRALKTGTVR